MNESCPRCHTRFERAPGYFVGAMYISYGFGVLVLIVMVGLFQLEPFRSWPIALSVGAATAVYLLLVPAIFRWSRILWIHIGQRAGW